MEDKPASGQATCAMVLAEITKSRTLVAASDCSAHTRKVLDMQLLQLEHVATVVQKGEGVVVGGASTSWRAWPAESLRVALCGAVGPLS
jgi:hypothetical protein